MTLDPKEGEVLVRLTASGLCHSDEHLRIGELPSTLPTSAGTKVPGSSRRSDQAWSRLPKGITSSCASSQLWSLSLVRDRSREPVRTGCDDPRRISPRRHQRPDVHGRDRPRCACSARSRVRHDPAGIGRQDRPQTFRSRTRCSSGAAYHRLRYRRLRRNVQTGDTVVVFGIGGDRGQRSAGRLARRSDSDHRHRPASHQPRVAREDRRDAMSLPTAEEALEPPADIPRGRGGIGDRNRRRHRRKVLGDGDLGRRKGRQGRADGARANGAGRGQHADLRSHRL